MAEVLRAAKYITGNNEFLANGAKGTIKSQVATAYYNNNKAALLAANPTKTYGEVLIGIKRWVIQGRNPDEIRGPDGVLLDPDVGKKLGDDQVARVLALAAAVNTAETQKGQGTNVEIRTNNVSLLAGVKLGQNKNLEIYGGPVAQRLKGQVHLRGIAYSTAIGYDAMITPDQSYGWLAGIAYSKPEIALKAALTYRSKIDHDTTITEEFPALGKAGITTTDFGVSTPESWNLDFQTGLSAKYRLLGTAKVRYVPWSDFEVRPPTYGTATARQYQTALPIVSYDKDQWQVELGLGHKINDKLSVAGNIGWDSGAGDPATTLGPIKGYYSVGAGVKFNFTPEWSLSVGGKYLKFGDTNAVLPTYALVGDAATVGRFEDNDGFVAGVKLAYQSK